MINKKKIKCLVTGNKGFIGTKLERKLKELGFEVKGFDIKNSLAEDIRNKLSLENVFSKFKPEVVIHLAALAGVRNSLLNPQDYFETNITGTYYLLEMCRKYNVKLLSASSSSVYGERIEEKLNENMICDNQLSPYAVSKKAGELLCKMFKDVQTIVFRPFTVYGGKLEEMRKDMVLYKLIKAGREKTVFHRYGDGNSIRGYTNVYDLIEGIIELINFNKTYNFDIFNLGGSQQVSLNELIGIVKEKYPDLKVEEIERNFADVVSSCADITKATELLRWKPIRNFKNEIIKICN